MSAPKACDLGKSCFRLLPDAEYCTCGFKGPTHKGNKMINTFPPFQLGSPNEHLRARIERLTSHPDFSKFIEHLSLIGTNPSTLAELVKKALDSKTVDEATAFEKDETQANLTRYQVTLQLALMFSNVAGYSEPPYPHLINV